MKVTILVLGAAIIVALIVIGAMAISEYLVKRRRKNRIKVIEELTCGDIIHIFHREYKKASVVERTIFKDRIYNPNHLIVRPIPDGSILPDDNSIIIHYSQFDKKVK